MVEHAKPWDLSYIDELDVDELSFNRTPEKDWENVSPKTEKLLLSHEYEIIKRTP